MSSGEHGFHGGGDGGRGQGFSQVVEHQGGAPDLPDGVGDAFAGDIRGGAVDGFEEAGEFAFGVDVAAGAMSTKDSLPLPPIGQ